MKVKFPENLKILMKEYGFTQQKLANAIHISQSAISAWLNGKKEPSIVSLWLLADLFSLSVDELIGRKDF